MPDNEANEMQVLLSDFHEICDKNLEQYFETVRFNSEHPELFSEEMKNMLVEYGILQFFGQWECFIEQCFIGYMLGGKSTSGDSPNRYVFPIDAEHAYKIVQNVNQYPDWTDIDKIVTNANNFFENGGPFAPLNTMKGTLNEIKKVRNAIAHTSKNAKRAFENLVRSKVGHAPDGITPAKFLSEQKIEKRKNAQMYYEYYINYVKSTANLLCSFSKKNDVTL